MRGLNQSWERFLWRWSWKSSRKNGSKMSRITFQWQSGPVRWACLQRALAQGGPCCHGSCNAALPAFLLCPLQGIHKLRVTLDQNPETNPPVEMSWLKKPFSLELEVGLTQLLDGIYGAIFPQVLFSQPGTLWANIHRLVTPRWKLKELLLKHDLEVGSRLRSYQLPFGSRKRTNTSKL